MTNQTMKHVRETLADTQHEIWSHWMRYVFLICPRNEDGSVTIPANSVERWQQQMNTPYAELAEREQASDLEQADKVIAAIQITASDAAWTQEWPTQAGLYWLYGKWDRRCHAPELRLVRVYQDDQDDTWHYKLHDQWSSLYPSSSEGVHWLPVQSPALPAEIR